MRATENTQQEGTRADKDTKIHLQLLNLLLGQKVSMSDSRVIPWTIKWNLYFNSLLPLQQHSECAQT